MPEQKWTESIAGVPILNTLFDANTILKADTDDTPEALTIAASRIVARLAAGEIIAATIQQVLNLLMTTQNDIITRNGTNPIRLNIGQSRIPARLAAGNLVAATIQQVLNLLMATKGDLIVRNATVPDILSVGSDGEFLVPNSSTSTGLEWVGIVTYEGVVVVNEGQVVYT
jgi:hypothetical protein